jgi:hypothetical protein
LIRCLETQTYVARLVSTILTTRTNSLRSLRAYSVYYTHYIHHTYYSECRAHYLSFYRLEV